MKLSTFRDQSHLPVDLIDAVVEQMGGKESFKESAPDVSNHGIDGGFHGFTYHSDTVEFAKKHIKPIMSVAEQMADDLGESGALELIAGFGCLNGSYSQSEIAAAIHTETDDAVQVLNALAWFAAEEVCRSYTDLREQN